MTSTPNRAEAEGGGALYCVDLARILRINMRLLERIEEVFDVEFLKKQTGTVGVSLYKEVIKATLDVIEGCRGEEDAGEE